ncbi:Rha family transcriptional regulator [Clostridium felsineum]|uniref:Rha family transcriptional regulator n=1 Tax=Clostridium felsineum TaxID=36839 RepID=UPI00098BE93E|nr:Rha family transcriptional regulator [Clostridium felsineum]URZ15448.1 hypothetical protein CLFE_014880 [Clostridium felsineum DSM 794]
MENELVNSINKEVTLDSREVAEMVGKRHDHLVRDVETYSNQIEEANKTILKTHSKLRTSDYNV